MHSRNPWSQPCPWEVGKKRRKCVQNRSPQTNVVREAGTTREATVSGVRDGILVHLFLEGAEEGRGAFPWRGGKRFRAGSMNEKSRRKPVRRCTAWLRSSSLRFLKGDVWVLPLPLPCRSSVIWCCLIVSARPSRVTRCCAPRFHGIVTINHAALRGRSRRSLWGLTGARRTGGGFYSSDDEPRAKVAETDGEACGHFRLH